jgi:hypothetical protein
LDRNKERSSLDNSPGKSTQLDPIADRQLFNLIVSQFALRLWSSLPLCPGYGCLMRILDGCGLGFECAPRSAPSEFEGPIA